MSEKFKTQTQAPAEEKTLGKRVDGITRKETRMMMSTPDKSGDRKTARKP